MFGLVLPENIQVCCAKRWCGNASFHIQKLYSCLLVTLITLRNTQELHRHLVLYCFYSLKKGARAFKNSLLLEIGPVAFDAPLNPGLLHGVVIRGTKNFSETLKDLRTPQVVEEVQACDGLAVYIGLQRIAYKLWKCFSIGIFLRQIFSFL